MRLALRLKQIQRQGWVDRGVPEPESSADHSWSVALFAWLVAFQREDLDAKRVLLMALIHDLPEALVGDATPFDRHRDGDGGIPKDHFRDAPVYDEVETRVKHERERVALLKMIAVLDETLTNDIVALWDEYNASVTAEARFVRQMDKLETLLQAENYLEEHPEIIIASFRAGTRRDVVDADLQPLLNSILDLAAEDD